MSVEEQLEDFGTRWAAAVERNPDNIYVEFFFIRGTIYVYHANSDRINVAYVSHSIGGVGYIAHTKARYVDDLLTAYGMACDLIRESYT